MAHKIMRKNLIGQKFGKLTVVSLDEEKTKDTKVYWNCLCECGRKTSVQSTSLTRKRGSVKSCGCLRNSKEAKEKAFITSNSYPQDITGFKFGKLTVVKKTNKRSNKKSDENSYLWECKCECENVVYYSRYRLISSMGTKSCGCYHVEKLNKKTQNTYDLSKDYGIGYCDNGNVFYFDLEDYDKIKNFKWNYDGKYVQAHKDKTSNIRFHRLILGLTEDDDINVDHKNHCTFDNRKVNLRLATDNQNCANKKECFCTIDNPIGIKKSKGNKFYVTIQGEFIGSFDSFEEAYKTRKEEEIKRFGEFLYNPNGDYYGQKEKATN